MFQKKFSTADSTSFPKEIVENFAPQGLSHKAFKLFHRFDSPYYCYYIFTYI